MNRQEKSKRNSAQLQRSLVASLQENRIEHFERVLIDFADTNYQDEEIKFSVFELACITPGKSAFIEKCMVHGVQLNKMNPDTGKYPIHLAAESHDASNLVVLLNQPTLLMDQETREGKTALCILCDTITTDNWNNVFECIKLLVDCHANINKPSNDGKTPIQWLIENSILSVHYKKHILIYCSMNCFLNVSQEIKHTIQYKYNEEIPKYTAQHKHFDELRDLLNNVEDEQIVAGFKINNPNTIGFTAEMIRKLLEMCIYRCKPLAAQQIIKSKLDNGKLNNPSKPLGGLLAKCCKLGACEMLRLLLDLVPKDSRGRDFLNVDPLLLYVVESMDSKVHKNSCDLFECMEILLRDPRIEIDKRDGLNRTALQIAGRCKNDHAQKLLLAQGAYIGGRDIDGYHTIGEINLEVLKKHFDSCIIVSDSPLKKIEQFEVDVTNLVEPRLKSGYKEHGYEHTNDTTFHDVLLLPLDLMKFDSMEPNEIILHPLISCWLHLKWLRCRPVWWVEFGFCTTFLVCFHGFVMLCYYSESSKTEWYTSVLAVLALMVGLPYMFLVINQLCLKRIEGTRYIAGWLKLVMLVLAASFLGNHHFVDEEMQRVIASFTLLCSGFVFIVTIDTVSRLSLSTHILMLQVVFLNLLKCLIPCAIIVCTFAMSFHMLLHKQDVAQTFETSDVGSTTESVISISEEFHAFKYLGLAFQKTAVMMTGKKYVQQVSFLSSMDSFNQKISDVNCRSLQESLMQAACHLRTFLSE
uniref:Ion transport domain-containing protein n=1 Tax=Anopheles atroparvus TaxID=41427 RepID=A0AAG5DP82_ANOAO